MELYDVMRTTFSAREFTDHPLSDATLYQILEHARFAPEWWQPPRLACYRRAPTSDAGSLGGAVRTAGKALCSPSTGRGEPLEYH